MNSARVARHDGRLWLSISPFSQFLVDDLNRLPSRQRGWDGDFKLWWFDPSQGDNLAGILEYHGYAWRLVAPDELGLVEHRVAIADPYSVLMLAPGAPLDLVALAYKFWAKRLHPDAGGDTASMQAVNAAYQALTAKERA